MLKLARYAVKVTYFGRMHELYCVFVKKKKHPHHHHHRLNYTEILHVIQKTIMAMLPLVYLQR